VSAFALALAVLSAASPQRVEVEILSRLAPRALVAEGHGGRRALAARGDRLLVDGQPARAPHRLPHGAWRVTVPGAPIRSYRAALSIRAERGLLRVRARMDLEEYVAEVVASETVPGTHPEALAAQAVVVRSYALAARGRHPGDALCDLAHCQVLRGHGLPRAHVAASRDATRATEREVLLLPTGAIAATPFHAACGGHTADPREVFGGEGSGAAAVPDAGCSAEPWHAAIDHDVLARAVRAALVRSGSSGAASVPARLRSSDLVLAEGRGGFVSGVASTDGRFRISGDAFARALDGALGWGEVRSARLALSDIGGRVAVRGSGVGHGVGLCQAGASRRARAGEGHRKILRHYFPGAAIGDPSREPARRPSPPTAGSAFSGSRYGSPR